MMTPGSIVPVYVRLHLEAPMRMTLHGNALMFLLLFFPSYVAGTCGTPDADGDGYPADVDCNDNDASIHPDQEEPCVCDNIDQNCNGVVDDFPCDLACPVDKDQDGYASDVDCNDSDPKIHPGQDEPCACDGIDQNCDGKADNFPSSCNLTCSGVPEGGACGGDFGSCQPGLVCCYPCGVYGCQDICMQPCTDSWCSNGCPLYP